MKLIKKVENINSFSVFNGVLFAEDEKNNTILSNENKFIGRGDIYSDLDNGYFFDIYKDRVDIYNYKLIKEIEIEIEIEKEGIISAGTINKLELFSIRWKDLITKEEFYSFYSFGKLLFTIPKYLGKIINPKLRLIYNSYTVTEIKACKLNDSVSIWEFNLPENFKIFGKIQVIDNILFFTAFKNVNKAQNVYGIDIHSGQIQWELNYSIPYTTYVLASLINSEDNLCYGYGGHIYQVFDPIRGEIILTKDMSEYYNQGIDPILPVNSLSEDKLWFVSGRGENAKFGALNIKNSEIEFIQDYPLENDGRLGKSIYHQGKLYLKDDSNVLHVFE